MKRPNYFNIAIITFTVIALGALGYYGYTSKYGNGQQTYSNDIYGIAFAYPKNYKVEENALTGSNPGTAVVLMDKKSIIPANGEGPVAITIGMYPSSLSASSSLSESDPILSWIKSSPYSNFSQSQQNAPSATTIANQSAYLYTWDGLYNGTTIVTAHNGNIIAFSVTYDGNNDLQIRQDFTDLVASVQFLDGNTNATSSSAANPIQDINAPPKRATLTGTYECIPHKNPGDAQTLECSFGIKAENGQHYALNLADIDAAHMNTEMNTRIKVSGLLVPVEQLSSDHWQIYDIKGIMKVDAFEKL